MTSKDDSLRTEVATDGTRIEPKKGAKKSNPTGRQSRLKRTTKFRESKNDETDAMIQSGALARLKVSDPTYTSAIGVQRDNHPTAVPISFRRLRSTFERTWDVMEAVGPRPFSILNTAVNRQIYEKGMLLIAEAKLACAQRAHIDKPDEDLLTRKSYTSEKIRDLNNMVTSLPLPLAMYVECIGNIKTGDRIITPILSEHEQAVLSGAITYAPQQLLPLLRILKAGVPRDGPIHLIAHQINELPGIEWEEFTPQVDGPVFVRLTNASADFWLIGPANQEQIKWTDAEYRTFVKITKSLNTKKGFNVELDIEHGNGTLARELVLCNIE